MSAAQTVGHDWSVLAMPSDARDHASRLINLGLHPIELHSLTAEGQCTCGSDECQAEPRRRGKHPASAGWQKSKLDSKRLDSHLKGGRRNLGLRMGAQPDGSSLITIDVDGDLALLDPLTDKWGELPPTLTQRTGSGGTHLVFRWPSGRELPANSVGKISPKIDVRSEGGQIVAAPSKHHSGGRYTWTQAIEPAELPATWVEGLTERPKTLPLTPAAPVSSDLEAREKRGRAYIEKMPPAVSGSNGHDALWDVARKLVQDFGMDEQAAFRVIMSEYNPRCSPPWSEKDVRHKVSDAATKARVKNPIEDRQLPAANWRASKALEESTAPVHQDGHDVQLVRADEWRKYLKHNHRDELLKTVGNVTLILKNAEGFKGCLRYDLLARRAYWHQQPEYRVGINPPEAGEPLADHHIGYIQHVLLTLFQLDVSKDIAWSAVDIAAHEDPIHPVQEYLASLEWDGEPRLDTFFSKYFGAKQTKYTAAIWRKFLISAVARAFQPGCQCDYMLVIEGSQGIKKDQGIKALMPNKAWYSETAPDLDKEVKAVEDMQGKWIVAWGEMDTLKSARLTKVKEFITKQVDRARAPYGRFSEDRPRSCAFIGTTNERCYLDDSTGARRFWPGEATCVNVAGIADVRDQVWAEAKAYYDAGEQWFLDSPELEALATAEQADRTKHDAREELVREWLLDPFVPGLDGKSERINPAEGISVSQIALGALKMRPQDIKSVESGLGRIMTRLGWQRKQLHELPGSPRRYFKPDEQEAKV